ncbi:capsid assembly scaffolding protein Gp46 family protein [Streptococcus pluranimalium]|uniref:capsid assembly scaffolding protein Gp46 family protein n=1 Tax=Streptococcus pluranimalium TaxID=82348 RepID=UPI003F67B55F
MAEEQQVQATENQEAVDTQEKTVSLAEMQRRLAKSEEQHEKQLAELRESNEAQIAQAIEKYKAESELSGKELEEYRRQEAEREKQALLDKIANLEKEQTKRELTDEAIKTLGTRNLPVTDKVLNFVVRDTADDTLQAIDDMEAIITDIKAQYTTSQPPKTSNAIGGSDASINRSDIFRNANIRKK